MTQDNTQMVELRRLPVLMLHFPSAPSVDFADADQRMVIQCSCGETFRERESSRVMENWAHHAMDAQAACGGLSHTPEPATGPAHAKEQAAGVDGYDLLLLRAMLCLSGFAGQGLFIEGFEDPAEVYSDIAQAIGMEDADDHDLRQHIAIEKTALSNALASPSSSVPDSAPATALVEALEEIANPLAEMQRRAEARGAKLDGMMANRLANDAEYLKGIARQALSTLSQDQQP